MDSVHNKENRGGVMVKRINISISDELYDKVQSAKKGFSKDFSISKICQQAIEKELDDAKARAFVWRYGFEDAKTYVELLSPEERIRANKMVTNFPRNYPDNLMELLLKAGLIELNELNNFEKLKKHIVILGYWNNVYDKFDDIELMVPSWCKEEDFVDILSWCGRSLIYEGEEIDDIPVEIRWEKIDQLWREGFIAGIKEATKSVGEDMK
jgi:predicted CopG family antitoxin